MSKPGALSVLRATAGFGFYSGILVYLLALGVTLLLSSEQTRLFAVGLLIIAGILAILIWGKEKWAAPFASDLRAPMMPRQRLSRVQNALIGLALCLVLFIANAYQAANPSNVFGLAGWLWLTSIALLIGWTFAWSRPVNALSTEITAPQAANIPSDALPVVATVPVRRVADADDAQHIATPEADKVTSQPWPVWELGVFALIVLLALLLRVWNLRDFPNNIYPDEIMTGTIAEQSFGGANPASIFSTVWGGIDLPALWFFIVSLFLHIGGDVLAMLRLPAALFGAATVVPFYFLMREVWGRTAAIAGTAMLAFSASNIHYSRLGLNNIVTQFFWVACFLFLVRGLRYRRPSDWALAGLFAGLSENFYYGTRLLPFILSAFFVYLLVAHWRNAKTLLAHFALTALGYLVGFGPLLGYFLSHPGLYFGRGAQMMVWNRVPTSWDDLQQMGSVLGPIISENLLGISTHTSQDIIYFGTLLLVPEAALVVLGFALLVWKWKHPAAFLMLLSVVGVLFVGGSLVFYPNSIPPLINHWTPAFPIFYCAAAIPIGHWIDSGIGRLTANMAWARAAALAPGLVLLGWLNISYYFGSYHADPDSLKSPDYRTAQGNYDVQVAESRFVASLGTSSVGVVVGRSAAPYDAESTRYLLGSNTELLTITEPEKSLVVPDTSGKAKVFIFFPGNEQYRALVSAQYPGGIEGQVYGDSGKLAFYTYASP